MSIKRSEVYFVCDFCKKHFESYRSVLCIERSAEGFNFFVIDDYTDENAIHICVECKDRLSQPSSDPIEHYDDIYCDGCGSCGEAGCCSYFCSKCIEDFDLNSVEPGEYVYRKGN